MNGGTYQRTQVGLFIPLLMPMNTRMQAVKGVNNTVPYLQDQTTIQIQTMKVI